MKTISIYFIPNGQHLLDILPDGTIDLRVSTREWVDASASFPINAKCFTMESESGETISYKGLLKIVADRKTEIKILNLPKKEGKK